MQSALQSGVHQSQLGMWQKFKDQGPLQKVFLPNTAIDLQIPILRRLVSISSSIGWVFCISLKWSNIQRNWECSQKRSLKASIERTVSVNNESGVSTGIKRNGIFHQKIDKGGWIAGLFIFIPSSKMHDTKVQLISESTYEVIVSPKIWTKNC